MNEPKQKPGRSKQDYGTDPKFLAAIERRFGKIGFDLAARADNAVVLDFYSPEQDSLKQDWTLPGVQVAFLNPPFADIRPWAEKCESVRNLPRWTLMLVPASMGSRWWWDHVIDKCQADGITRITFVGETIGYPKDLALCCYGFGVKGQGFWPWKPPREKKPKKEKTSRASAPILSPVRVTP